MLAAGTKPVEQFSHRREPTVPRGEQLQQPACFRVELPAGTEPLPKVRGHDADATIGFQLLLIRRPEQVVEFVYVFGVSGGEPPADIRAARVPIGHGGIDAPQVDLRKGQVADVLDLLDAEVAPPIGRPRAVPLVQVRRLPGDPAAEQSQHGIVEPAGAPVQVVAIVRVVGVHARRRAEDAPEALQRPCDSRARARLHRGAVEGDLEPAGVEVDHKVVVGRVVQCLGKPKVSAALLAAHRPHGLRRAHPQRFQQAIDRPNVLHRRDIGVVHHRECEACASRELEVRPIASHDAVVEEAGRLPLWVTTAATNPGAGEKLSIRQPQRSPGVSSTRRIRAGSAGASDTSKRSSGKYKPSPSALMKASLRVQQLTNPSGRARASRAWYASRSQREKKRTATSSAPGITRTASRSMPISRPRENAYTATSSQCATLKRRPEFANRAPSAGLPRAPWTNSTARGCTPNRAASSCRNRARPTMNRRRTRSRVKRLARCRSASESSAVAAQTASRPATKRVTTTSMASVIRIRMTSSLWASGATCGPRLVGAAASGSERWVWRRRNRGGYGSILASSGVTS